jgi:hypothetical protein
VTGRKNPVDAALAFCEKRVGIADPKLAFAAGRSGLGDPQRKSMNVEQQLAVYHIVCVRSSSLPHIMIERPMP